MNIERMLHQVAIKRPKSISQALKKTLPRQAFEKTEVYQHEGTLLLITDPAWFSWLKLNRQQLKSILPAHLSIKILTKHHMNLTREEPKHPNKRTLSEIDADALLQLGAQCGHDQLKQALSGLVKRHQQTLSD